MNVVKPFGKISSNETLRLSLCDTNPAMTDVWIDFFHDVDAVEIVQGNLLDLDCQALVSPANSFGDMSGGLDKQIDDFYQGQAQTALMAAIRDRYLGEMPVGTALIVQLPRKRFPFLVAAPTMRTPSNVAGTINAYLAFRAALAAIVLRNQSDANPILRLAVPGLCTGVGGMSYGAAAQQMRAAYDNILGGGWKDIVHPAMAPFALSGSSGKTLRWS